MSTELRCDAKLHGIVVEQNTVEVKCKSNFCGAHSGTVVLHRFLIEDGSATLISTTRFKEPGRRSDGSA